MTIMTTYLLLCDTVPFNRERASKRERAWTWTFSLSLSLSFVCFVHGIFSNVVCRGHYLLRPPRLEVTNTTVAANNANAVVAYEAGRSRSTSNSIS